MQGRVPLPAPLILHPAPLSRPVVVKFPSGPSGTKSGSTLNIFLEIGRFCVFSTRSMKVTCLRILPLLTTTQGVSTLQPEVPPPREATTLAISKDSREHKPPPWEGFVRPATWLLSWGAVRRYHNFGRYAPSPPLHCWSNVSLFFCLFLCPFLDQDLPKHGQRVHAFAKWCTTTHGRKSNHSAW